MHRYVIFKCATLKSKKVFKVTVKPACFFEKKTFFLFFQNGVVKHFQSAFIQKKIMKIEKTNYKKKFLSPNFFQKKSKLTSVFLLKVSKFSKNSHFALKMAKMAKNGKLSKILKSILIGVEWFFEKKFGEWNFLLKCLLSIFHFFFDWWSSKMHKNEDEKSESSRI